MNIRTLRYARWFTVLLFRAVAVWLAFWHHHDRGPIVWIGFLVVLILSLTKRDVRPVRVSNVGEIGMTSRNFWRCLMPAVALTTTWLAPLAKAATLTASDNGSILISGRIQSGDETRFQSLLLRFKERGPIEVHLNSNGGSVQAAMKIADMVHKAGLTTRVPYRATCASACALVFAAGVSRTANAQSRIAVHSLGVPGRRDVDQKMVEDDLTLAMTTQFARRMSDYGAPPSVVGKLVTTPNDRTSVLTIADLEAWNVKIERDIPSKEISEAGEFVKGPMPPFASSDLLATAPSIANPTSLRLTPPAARPTQLNIPDRVGPPSGPTDPAQPSSQAPVAAVAQRVVLYEEDPGNPQGKRYVGSAIWRTETVTPRPGAAPDLAVRADLEIPGHGITMTFSLRRNTDQGLPASHTIELTFNLPADFPFGGILSVPGVLMKQAEAERGAPLAGFAVKVTPGFFLVELSAVEADMQRNLQLLKERAWFDIPIVYNNGRRAILVIDKGPPGEHAFEEVFKAWGQTSADPARAPGGLATPDDGASNGIGTVPPGAPVYSQPLAGAYVVQVSAQKTEAEALSHYRSLRARYPGVLGSRSANIRRVDLGDKGVYYRAQIGPFATSEQANTFCSGLKDAGGQCIVQKN